MSEAFFVPDGDRFLATELTRGPWSPRHQHGGPPAALVAHVVARDAPGFTITRMTVDFLRPVPIDRLGVRVETLRAGTKVRRMVATLLHGETAVAHALVVLVCPSPAAAAVRHPGVAPPLPEASEPFQFPFFREPTGYHTAMESRLARGRWGTGDAAIWMRQRVPLLADRPLSPIERVLVAADSGSGVSAAIDPARHTAVNADLTVAVHRTLEGEWVGLDSVSTYEADGIGLADTLLWDVGGPVGRVLQGLLIEARPGG